MSSTFQFIPRKVAKVARAEPRAAPVASSSTLDDAPHESSLTVASQNPHVRRNIKGKEKETTTVLADSDYAIILSLSLSNYALWSDPDLRRTIESNDEGFIPLSYLLTNGPFLSSPNLTPVPSELVIARAVREHAAHSLEIRMVVSEPSRGNWYKKDVGNVRNVAGGYEVRRKDWKDAVRHAGEMTREKWHLMTVYLENIPPQYRTIAGIYRFALGIVRSPHHSTPQLSPVQNITLPRHHQDKPGAAPKCKGFALVTLATPEDVDALLHRWPWNHKSDVPITQESEGEEEAEATKFGLKSMSKKRWDELKEEYIGYRKRILDEIAASDEQVDSKPETNERVLPESNDTLETMTQQPSQLPPQSTELSSPYPLHCLIFVRNINPSTNKTTLRTLFSSAFSMKSQAEGLDYVDFNKGMDSCYLRVATANHASLLISHFTSHPTTQKEGLDSTGTAPSASPSGTKPVLMELVTGTKEEMYWGKVPEKVRREAVRKAVGSDPGQREEEMDATQSGKRKRRRK